MMNETISLGGRATVGFGECPVIRPEGIYYGGRRVIRLGLSDAGVGDLLAYRQMWEPFIAAHLALWRDMNYRYESLYAPKCPPGIFTYAQIQNLDPKQQSQCASLALTRMMTSDTDPDGILPQWNAWKDQSSAQMLAGASAMLAQHQAVVMSVGGRDKDRLLEIAKQWGIEVKLPDLPSFSTQQELIARTEGAYITTKGVLKIAGYEGPGETIKLAADVTQAVAEGLSDTAKALPKTFNWVAIVGTVAAVVVGGALIVYYVPRRREPTVLPRREEPRRTLPPQRKAPKLPARGTLKRVSP